MTKTQAQDGFTLIELAISTIIIGLLLAAVITPYSIWVQKERIQETAANVEIMAVRVSAFRTDRGYFPCPAALDADRTAPNYGAETDCSVLTPAIGTCDTTAGNRICRAARLDGPVTVELQDGSGLSSFTPTVRIGAIPFRALGIAEEYTYDSYGNRLLYAITEERATQTLRNVPGTGAIVVEYEDETGARVRHLANDTSDTNSEDAEFIVLSHGADKRGGYTFNGNSNGIPCDLTNNDGENCDFDTVFFSQDKFEGAGAAYHDDVAAYQMPLSAPFWARSTTNKNNIYSIRSKETDGRVGSDYLFNHYDTKAKNDALIDYAAIYEKSKLWVGGNLLVEPITVADTGQAQVNKICDRDGENCFEPKMIGGEGVECDPTTSIMEGFKEGGADCGPPIVTIKCDDPDEFLKGFNNGVKDCDFLPCQGKQVNVCGTQYTLDDAVHGTRSNNISSGGKYRCNSVYYICDKGSWDPVGTPQCSCTPSRQEYEITCPSNCSSGIETWERGTTCALGDCDDPFNRRISAPCSNCVTNPPPTCTGCGCPGQPACPPPPPTCTVCDCPGQPACPPPPPPTCTVCDCPGQPACPPGVGIPGCKAGTGGPYGPCIRE